MKKPGAPGFPLNFKRSHEFHDGAKVGNYFVQM